MSIAGFVLALIGLLVLPVVFGPLGIVLSALGLKSGKKKGLAIAGLIIGIVDTVYFLLTIL